MKNQLNLLNQLQELVFTRDEHNQTGDGSHLDSLNNSIETLTSKLDPQPKAFYQRLYKKDHVVMSPVINECCAVCGMRLPISQVQQVRLAKDLQTCSSCGRILFYEEDDAPRATSVNPVRPTERKTGVSRFSAEELMSCELQGTNPQAAISELINKMVENRFVSNPEALLRAAMEREIVLPTSLGNGVACPHVRGVEGGGLTLALGISMPGIKWGDDGEAVHIVCFSVIPVAVSAFYLRLIALLSEAFSKKENHALLLKAKNPAELWKAFMKATRHSVR